MEGYTTFRFYINNATRVDINIYDINGLKVEGFQTLEISQNEYNEVKWNNINNMNSGLYYAEVIFNNNRKSELIKLAIIQ